MYNGEVVALKVIGLSQDDSEAIARGRVGSPRIYLNTKAAQRVRALYNPHAGASFVVVLTDGVAVLRGSGFDEAA
jgi:hypothetical protein